MQPDLLRVDVVALRVMGRDVIDAAATLRETVKATGPGLAPPAEPGSAAATAARAAEKAWLTSLNRLTVQVDQLGRKMTRAADSYQATDQAGADELRPSGSPGF
ncbi:type VII secretion target [Actinoplanes sp. NEAU-A12]|uniref:Type VII secretion target n=1 Tax=Actinoplanes sandaracinus TaxID=3045177 RepID=A0ABT6WBW5_9ACTN|nr:type VII secretion target [Actinoplanes sandaracinus]MDI6097234.1 type VII secretion target [Actinoplanes sandaracinus]